MQRVTVAPDNTHSVGLLWTKDWSVAETCTHNTYRQISMLLAGFGPTIPASERPQTYALDRAATGNGVNHKRPKTDAFASGRTSLNIYLRVYILQICLLEYE